MKNLNNAARYIVTDNCILTKETDEKSKNFGKVKIVTGRNVVKELGTLVEIDKRFNLATVHSTMDIQEYINYYVLFLREVENFISNSHPSGEFVNQLDMGYIPVFAPPTYLCSKLIDKFRNAIRETGLTVYEKPSMRVDGTHVNSDSKDLWCSRLELSQLLKKHPCAIKVMDYLQILIPHLV